jgi:small-conductance mechanosensitive channel
MEKHHNYTSWRPWSSIHQGRRHRAGRLLFIRLLLFIWLAGMSAAPAIIAADGEVSPTTSAVAPLVEPQRAAVTLDGHVLFYVRGGSAYLAERRARAISERIRAVTADPSVSTDSLRVVETEERSDILAGDTLVVSLFDVDAELEGVPRKLAAAAGRARIAEVITAYRYDRSPRVLLVNTGYALGATLVALLLLFGAGRAFRWLEAVGERRFKSRIEGLEAQSFQLIRATQLRTALGRVLTTLRTVLVVVIAYLYLNFVLGLYPWSRPLAQQLFSLFLNPLYTLGAAFLASLPNLVFVAILVILTRYVLKLTWFFFTGIDQGTITLANFDREWALPTYRITRLLIIAFALVIAYPYIPGSESEAFKGVSIFLGVIFSLGSSSVIANIIAGYSMTYRRAFKIGDRVKLGDFVGDVVEVRLMVTRLRSVKNEEIIIPNSTILGGEVVNYSSFANQQGLILHTTVGIGYETPWRQVEAMLRLAADRTPGLLKQPPPFVLQKALGDFAVTYELNVYCDNPSGMARLYTALHQRVLDVFNEYGVQIMTPAYEGDPQQPKVVPKDQWVMEPATEAVLTDGVSDKVE